MKTCSIALKKIQNHFSRIGFTIIVTPVEEFSNPNGWYGPSGRLREEWTVKNIDRMTVEVSDEISIGYLLHEIMHALLARPEWDCVFSGDTYNWNKRSLIREEFHIVVYTRVLLRLLRITQAAIDSSFIENEEGHRWKHPGGDIHTTDNLGRPTTEKFRKVIKYLSACGVTDKNGWIVGPFNLEHAKKNFDDINEVIKDKDWCLGTRIHPDSELAKAMTKMAA